jgi:hypothetical protein
MADIQGGLNGARTEELRWTEQTTQVLRKKKLETGNYITWSAYHASLQTEPTDPAAQSCKPCYG